MKTKFYILELVDLNAACKATKHGTHGRLLNANLDKIMIQLLNYGLDKYLNKYSANIYTIATKKKWDRNFLLQKLQNTTADDKIIKLINIQQGILKGMNQGHLVYSKVQSQQQ